MIEFTKPLLPPLPEYIKSLRKIWRSRRLTNSGHFHELLERKLEKALSVRNMTLTANGTLALQLLFKAMEIKGEVITTPFTFAATTNTLVWENIKPVFADVNPETFNLDPAQVEKKINKKTSAILAVHVFGNPCYPEEFEHLARRHKLKLIFDAAHAFGVKYKNRSVLNYGDASILSFHATKIFNTVEGGAVVVKDKKLHGKVKLLRNFGIDASKENVVLPGINAKLNEFQAALGLSNLKLVKNELARRKRIYGYYQNLLTSSSGEIKFQKIGNLVRYNYAYLPVVFKNRKTRDRVHRALLREDIISKKYFYPLTSNFLYFRKRINLPLAAKLADSILCLPLYSELSLKDVRHIVNVVEVNL